MPPRLTVGKARNERREARSERHLFFSFLSPLFSQGSVDDETAAGAISGWLSLRRTGGERR